MSSLIVEVCTIDRLEKHPGADTLDICSVKGWNCITKIGDFKEGDSCVFIPPDSILTTELIDKYNIMYLKNHGGRVGTTKLRGYISQGLLLSMDCLPTGTYNVGDDVADILGIKKWNPGEASYATGGRKASNRNPNPNFHKYTEIENIKNYPDIFTPDDIVVVTEKIHGTNWRAGKPKRTVRKGFMGFIDKVVMKLKGEYEFVYGSHNVQLSKTGHKGWYGDDLYGKVAAKYDVKNVLPDGYSLYGEAYGQDGDGTKVQDLTYGKKEIDLLAFDVKCGDTYLDYSDFRQFCLSRNIPIVPVLYVGPWYDDILKDYTDGESTICPGQIREGIVVKRLVEKNHPRCGRMILKSVSAAYLTRKNATEYK